MLYPIVTYCEWAPTNEPAFYKTKDGVEYCIVTISKKFTMQGQKIRATHRITCYDSSCSKIKYLIDKNGYLKNVPLDIIAEEKPYVSNGEIMYSLQAIKISLASSYYMQQENNTKKAEPELIQFMDSL